MRFDQRFVPSGTRFKLFPQEPHTRAFPAPETVMVSVPAGRIAPGPADERMYVVDPIVKRQHYEYPYLPPCGGPFYRPAWPDAEGHFDYLDINSREFRAAHMYGSIRFVLDIWEKYFGRRIEWHFRAHYPRLEIIPSVDWENAQSGYGFIEAGYGVTEAGEVRPYCLNFDVLAHETGHSIVFSQVGVPSSPEAWTQPYRSFHESCGDLVALVSMLHFHSVIGHLMATTQGNLYTLNEMDRIGELSETEQIRLACNSLKMSDLTPDMKDHGRSLPLTGAVFDFFVEAFQARLVEKGLISPMLADLSFGVPSDAAALAAIQAQFALAYSRNPPAFWATLLEARDYVGLWLAIAWSQIEPDDLAYADVASALVKAELLLSGGKYQNIIRNSLTWREIDFSI